MTTGAAFDKTIAQATEALRVYQSAHAVTLLTQLLTTLPTSPCPRPSYCRLQTTIADALMDSLLHNAYRLELQGGSLRKKDYLH